MSSTFKLIDKLFVNFVKWMPKLFLKKITAKDKNEDADANFFKMTTDEEVAYLQYIILPSRERLLNKVS